MVCRPNRDNTQQRDSDISDSRSGELLLPVRPGRLIMSVPGGDDFFNLKPGRRGAMPWRRSTVPRSRFPEIYGDGGVIVGDTGQFVNSVQRYSVAA